jgi:hypothetical protein
MDAEVSTHIFLTMIIEESVCFMSCEPFFFGAIILMWYTRNIILLASNTLFINWTLRMSDNLPERVQILGHAHIICITVRKNRIICSQIFCDLLLKSVFERIFNVMQLILVKIKWHIKRKYLIQKFHDICLSYYFYIVLNKILFAWFFFYISVVLLLVLYSGHTFTSNLLPKYFRLKMYESKPKHVYLWNRKR